MWNYYPFPHIFQAPPLTSSFLFCPRFACSGFFFSQLFVVHFTFFLYPHSLRLLFHVPFFLPDTLHVFCFLIALSECWHRTRGLLRAHSSSTRQLHALRYYFYLHHLPPHLHNDTFHVSKPPETVVVVAINKKTFQREREIERMS